MADASERAGAAGRAAGYAQVALAAATWGCWSLVFRPAERLAVLPPAFEAFVVFAVTAAVAAPLALWRGRAAARPSRPRRAWGLLVAYGACDAANALLFFAAMQRTSLAVAVLTHYLAPLLVALAAPFVLGEPLRLRTFLALGLSLGGLVLLLEPWSPGASASAVGAALGAGSALFYAANVVLAKRAAVHFSPLESLGFHMVPAAAVLALFVPWRALSVGPLPLGLLVAGGLIGGVGAGLLFLRGLARVPASHASVLTLLEPMVAVAIGALAFGEVPGPLAWLGGAIVLSGAAWVMRAEAPGAQGEGAPAAMPGAGA